MPGTVSSGELRYVQEGEIWLKGTNANAAKVPAQIADKLRGREFSSFDEFRNAFWKEVAADPVLSKQFETRDIYRMKNGAAPRASELQQAGGRKSYELDHDQEIQNGGNVYDLNNGMHPIS